GWRRAPRRQRGPAPGNAAPQLAPRSGAAVLRVLSWNAANDAPGAVSADEKIGHGAEPVGRFPPSVLSESNNSSKYPIFLANNLVFGAGEGIRTLDPNLGKVSVGTSRVITANFLS